jgi:hypothetical protein
MASDTRPGAIEELFAWIGTDGNNGEVVCLALVDGRVAVPLASSTWRESIAQAPLALRVSKQLGLPVRLVRFVKADEIGALDEILAGKDQAGTAADR